MNQHFKYTTYNPREYEIHHMALTRVPHGSKVLELGCATGYITKLLSENACEVTGVELDKTAGGQAKKYAKKIIIGDLNYPSTLGIKETYDIILCLDVIEHLIQRNQLLKACKTWLKPGGTLILSTPNIAHLKVRLALLQGKFTYEKIGIMDETHVHFYTKETLVKEFLDAGFTIAEIQGSSDLGQLPLLGRILRKLPKKVQHSIVTLWPTLLSVQWLVTAT